MKIVVASGYFNPLHKGHVEYLEKAKSQFQTQSTNTILIPYWGSKRNEFFLNQCYEIKK
jgi:nicotinic acid mononucleotide adenylyltransferase